MNELHITAPVHERKEIRFPCVGVDLFYSPYADACLSDAAAVFYEGSLLNQSMGGMSFKVAAELSPGERIAILFSVPDGDEKEKLLAEVKWCIKKTDGYLIGTQIVSSLDEIKKFNKKNIQLSSELNEDPAPDSVRMICPSCRKLSEFLFAGIQEGLHKKGLIPIYNCSLCEGTRTITSILAFNRHKHFKK